MAQLEKQTRALRRKLNVVLEKLEPEAPAKAVHQLRTTARRLQTIIGCGDLRLRAKERQATGELEKIRRRAGKVRDLDVQLELLHAIRNQSGDKDRQAFRQALLKKRGRRADRLVSLAGDLSESSFSDRLHGALERVVSVTQASPQQQSRLRSAQLELERLSAQVAEQRQPRARQLHQLRIELKKVRYLAELQPTSEPVQHFMEQLKSAQAVLGEWRDWELLLKSAEKQFAGRIDCALLAQIRTRLAGRRRLVLPALSRLLLPSPERKQPQSALSRRALAQHA
jgi:CHAD domain-containing protein